MSSPRYDHYSRTASWVLVAPLSFLRLEALRPHLTMSMPLSTVTFRVNYTTTLYGELLGHLNSD